MTEEEIKILIGDLCDTGRFVKPAYFSGKARYWFASEIVAYLRKKVGDNPDILHTRALAAIQRATAFAETHLEPGGTILTKRLKERIRKRRRAQIIYGAIAIHPDVFLENDNQSLLDFITERRFRAVKRMELYVNTKAKSKIFVYPKRFPAHVNKQARECWSSYPFVLSDKGQDQPVIAIERLFEPNDTELDQNALGCALVATILHMDSLLKAKQPATLASKMVSEGPDYLTIDHPYGSFKRIAKSLIGGTVSRLLDEARAGDDVDVAVLSPWNFGTQGEPNDEGFLQVNSQCQIVEGSKNEDIEVVGIWCTGSIEERKYTDNKIRIKHMTNEFGKDARIVPQGIPIRHFLTDDRADKALFEQTAIFANKWQIGDHVYVCNHPLLAWAKDIRAGEHSFLIERWRHFGLSHFVVSGHGFEPMTVRDMTKGLLTTMNAILDEARDVVDICLVVSPDDLEWQQPNRAWQEHIRDRTLAEHTGVDFLGEFALMPYCGGLRPFVLLRGILGRFLLSLGLDFKSNLEQGTLSQGFRQEFENMEIVLSPNNMITISTEVENSRWRIHDSGHDRTYIAFRGSETISIYLVEKTIAHKDWILMMQPGLYLYTVEPVEPQPKHYSLAIRKNHRIEPGNPEFAEKKRYGFSYFNVHNGRADFLSLYYTADDVGRHGRKRYVRYKDMLRQRFVEVQPGRVYCTRPRVDPNPEYLAYLRQLGAIVE